MKIVIVAPRFPYPLEKGDKLRLFHQIKYLSKKNDIYLISLSNQQITYADHKPIEVFCKEIKLLQLKGNVKIKNLTISLLTQRPLQVAYYYQSWIKKEIDLFIEKINPDVVYFQLFRTAMYAEGIKQAKVLDIMDSFRLVAERNAQQSQFIYKFIYHREASLIKKFQNKWIPKFDKTIIISETDRNDIFKDVTLEPSEVIRNGIDTARFHSKNITKKYEISFIGNLGYQPNKQAIQYILRQLFPKLQSLLPDITLLIAGARTSEQLQSKNIKGIHFAGFMDDIQNAYDASRIFIAPLFSGAGLQNKILEAMAMGVPCVTTSMVNNSIRAIPDQQILIADNVEEFTQQIISLLQNESLYRQIKEEALRFVTTTFSWPEEVKKLEEVFAKIQK